MNDVAIIGAGPIGIFAAFKAGMLGMKSCVIDTLDEIGGQCSALYPEKPIYDIPSHPQIEASKLIKNLFDQASPFNPNYLLSRQVNSLVKEDGIFKLGTSLGDIVEAKSVLIAAGAGSFGPNRPPLNNIEKYEGKSVFYFVSKREMFAGKNIIIAGGGDSAIDWAISLSSIANVTIVHRRNKFRAAPSSIQKMHELAEKKIINIIINYQLFDLVGNQQEGKLEQVIVADLDGNQKIIETDILLPFFGLKQSLGPLSEFGLNIMHNHLQVTQPHYQTNVDGVYAVGDIAHYEGKLKLILTGFSEVAHALHHAYDRVFDGKALHFEHSTTKGVPK